MTVLASHSAPPLAAVPRDPQARQHYLNAALVHVPRLLGNLDRDAWRATYGCLDRNYWHYRTSDFPSAMYQEGTLTLALLWRSPLPGNRWHQQSALYEWTVAALRYSARSAHRDGSGDDYYPYERALGAAVFALQAESLAYQLLELNDPVVRDYFLRRARWIARHDESGRLSNHHALAALALARVAHITGETSLHRAAADRVRRLLSWQSPEGWFEEYGGADPGYQTITIDALANYQRLTNAAWLEEPLRRAVEFCRWFLHPDGSYAGEYGSRGTHHFYPHGMELLAGGNPLAADLADGFLQALAEGRTAGFDDDRLFAHRLGNLLLAYQDWSPRTPAPQRSNLAGSAESAPLRSAWFPQAGLWVREHGEQKTIGSTARGGTVKHFAAAGELPWTIGALVLELTDGRRAVSNLHDTGRTVVIEQTHATRVTAAAPHGEDEPAADSAGTWTAITVAGPLHWVRQELMTPTKAIVLRLVMLTIGRFFRTWIRRLLQRRLITGRRPAPLRFSRRVEFPPTGEGPPRISDTLELTDPRIKVRRLHLAVESQPVYTAAAAVYQAGQLQPSSDLSHLVECLNRDRRISFSHTPASPRACHE